MYLAHNLPHTPLYASDEFTGKSKRGLYGDVVEEIDHGIGRIIDELERNNLDRNTIVIFTSDNGPWLPFESQSGSAGLLREGKGSTWEGGHRVPGIFWGGGIKSSVIDDLGSTMDIFPTILEMSNSGQVDDRIIDGLSIKNTLLNLEPSKREKVIFYREREVYALRYRQFKAHFITKGVYDYPYPDIKTYMEKPLLYNLDIDPSEKYNIADENPEILKKIYEVLESHQNNLNAPEDLLQYRDNNGNIDGINDSLD